MTLYSPTLNCCTLGLIPQTKPLIKHIMTLITNLAKFISCLILSRRMDIELPNNCKDSKEYFTSMWNEDIKQIKGEKEKLKFSLCLIYEAISLNIEFYWLRKTKPGLLISKIIDKDNCSGCY